MSRKNQARPDGLAYSTNKDFFNDFTPDTHEQQTIAKEQQKLRVQLDTKQRAGKVVTLISGFIGSDEDLADLGKQLKTKCGAGGSAKEGLIIIQGDYKLKIIDWLRGWGYVLTK